MALICKIDTISTSLSLIFQFLFRDSLEASDSNKSPQFHSLLLWWRIKMMLIVFLTLQDAVSLCCCHATAPVSSYLLSSGFSSFNLMESLESTQSFKHQLCLTFKMIKVWNLLPGHDRVVSPGQSKVHKINIL